MTTATERTLAQQALEAYEAYQEKATQASEEDRKARQEREQGYLSGLLVKVFGSDIAATATYTDGEVYKASLPGIDNATFYCFRDSYLNSYDLWMDPVLTIPDGEAFEEWYENPLNHRAPRAHRVASLSDVGMVLRHWAEDDWEIKPRPPQQPAPPERFAEMTLREANRCDRPFKVLGLTFYDETTFLVVEYTGTKGPDDHGDDIPC